jgi:UDP-N-acetylmuramate--alanine ligase
MLSRRGVAVAGTHGKTTTTAMIAHVLAGCGLDPSFVIGGAPTGAATGGHLGGGDVMIVEADESDGSFLQYPCEVAVVTNIDPDHLSNWGSAENYADGFLRFATADSVRLLVTSADDPGAVSLTRRVRQQRAAGSPAPEILTFGTSAEADVQITDIRLAGTGSAFHLAWAGRAGQVELVVPGHYNVLNAAAAYGVASWLGVDDADIRRQLARYQGTYRRFQLIGAPNNIRVYDDYAHHPTEVAATIDAARTLGTRRVVAVFQPHLYSRTARLAGEFGAALARADVVAVLDVYPARERAEDFRGISGLTIAEAAADAARGRPVLWLPDFAAAERVLGPRLREGDLCLVLGAGNVDALGRRLVAGGR